MITSPCKITDVDLAAILSDYTSIEGDCNTIDKVLSSDKFASLRKVKALDRIPSDYFPGLKSRRLLEAREWAD